MPARDLDAASLQLAVTRGRSKRLEIKRTRNGLTRDETPPFNTRGAASNSRLEMTWSQTSIVIECMGP